MTITPPATFEGWVDFVCPRGWSYVTNSRFFGHSLTAASGTTAARTATSGSSSAARPSTATRVSPSAGTTATGSSTSWTAASPPRWPTARSTAFRDARVPLGACAPTSRTTAGRRRLPWFADNLDADADFSASRDITPGWTFGGQWDPEGDACPRCCRSRALPRPETGRRRGEPGGSDAGLAPRRATACSSEPSRRRHFAPRSSQPVTGPGGWQQAPLTAGAWTR